MKLASLEIFGFKSFADRTQFVFDKGITGIVGPNGCGKSNVVDSIRWVLGEQRTRNLRSDKMENVIFNGTESRRKSNFAEVSLTFENTRRLLPTEYTTVTITRKLYRTGESEYLINGVVCRLKDIQDLFLDTGIGSDTYAIIELKMVDEILTNREEERRRFIEEAAGISKYKTRKKQTLKKLEDTDGDLSRVEDILFEIDKNVKLLEKQARKTQRYFEIKEAYKLSSSRYAFIMSHNVRERMAQVEVLSASTQDQNIRIQSEQAQAEARLQELKSRLLDQEKYVADAQQSLQHYIRNIQEIEKEKSIKNERLKYLRQRELSIQGQIDAEKSQIKLLDESIAKLGRENGDLEIHAGRDRKEALQLKVLWDEKQTLLKKAQENLKELVAENRLKEMEVQDMQREKDILAVRIQSLRKELLRTEEDHLAKHEDLDLFTGKTEQLSLEIATLQQELSELTLLRARQADAIAATETDITDRKEKISRTNRVLDAKQNEHALTKSLVESLEGFPESVKFLKKNAKWVKDAPLLSDIFTCPETYKIAFENYLEPYLNYYVVQTREDAILAVHMLAESAKGRANFFILNELEQYEASPRQDFPQAKAALEVVEFGASYRKLAAFLLDKVYLIEKESNIPESLPDSMIFLTALGNLARRKYILSGGSLGLFEGKRLGRAKNLEKLEEEMVRLREDLKNEKIALDQSMAALAKLKEEEYAKRIENAQYRLMEKQRDLSVLQSREKEHREFLLKSDKQRESLKNELSTLDRREAEMDPQMKLLKEELLQIQTQNAKLQAEVNALLADNSELSNTYNAANVRMIQSQNKLEGAKRDLMRHLEELDRFQNNQERLHTDILGVRKDIQTLVETNLEEDDQMVELYEEKKKREEKVDLLVEQAALTRNSIFQVEESLSSIRKQREKLQQQLQDLKDKSAEIRIELNSLKERLSVEFSLDLHALEADALFDRPWESYDLAFLEQEVLNLRQKIQTIGEINPLAVEAYNEVKERFDFITTQKQDLLDAKNALLATIAEIDQTAKEKFLETFATVRTHFQEVFRSLFSDDDTCDLLLSDPEHPLDSEINIIARPKGKRPLTISQLSGGEKTLTAVALLFSLYLIKPAPFCIFDEVDAPLDDANIDKFNNIIRDFSKASQFIIVTHNKRTMASTNVMYGVTMENKGVSRVLPVSLEALDLN